MIKTLSSREAYRNAWMTVREDVVLRANGLEGIYGYIEKPDFALVIPHCDDGFWLVEQYRYPVARRAWEFPQGSWGTQKEGSQLDLARTELQEETGIEAHTIRHLGHLYGAHGMSSQGCDVYVATSLTQGVPQREDTEQDMVHSWFSEIDFVLMIQAGDVVDAATIAAFAYFTIDRSSRLSGERLSRAE
ncbi:NUDIX hydrolase [Cryobacterium sp. TMT2-42-4]|uniref:NUDIX domain-containing protein n=1 Tax=Cryobacterium sp. TMT2-42-4 TaxID=1259255 RepID=UPI001F53E96C|nr:NUDIX hydrolase [Cryobacterium sp. TMT2-42-4]